MHVALGATTLALSLILTLSARTVAWRTAARRATLVEVTA
jgi:hypothetical protein